MDADAATNRIAPLSCDSKLFGESKKEIHGYRLDLHLIDECSNLFSSSQISPHVVHTCFRESKKNIRGYGLYCLEFLKTHESGVITVDADSATNLVAPALTSS